MWIKSVVVMQQARARLEGQGYDKVGHVSELSAACLSTARDRPEGQGHYKVGHDS